MEQPNINDSDAKPMIFIVGASRSGTTMMSRALGNHSQIHGFPELHLFEELWDPADGEIVGHADAIQLYDRLLWTARRGYLSSWKEGEYRSEAASAVDAIKKDTAGSEAVSVLTVFKTFLMNEAFAHGKVIPCEQTPRNLFFLETILSGYPASRAIYMVRDPRDVLLSQKNRWKRRLHGGSHRRRDMLRDWIIYHPLVTPRLWLAANKAYRRWKDSGRVLCVHYEALVSQPDRELEKVCQFIGVPFERGLASVPRVGSSLHSDENSAHGMDASRVGNWGTGGLTRSEIYLCEHILGKEMVLQGYSPSGERFHLGVFYWYFTLPFRMFAAVLFNLGRARNVARFVLRRFAHDTDHHSADAGGGGMTGDANQ
jgi:omega-hydroxy-beta-dihydromenaquinone-9 sulfotransferase